MYLISVYHNEIHSYSDADQRSSRMKTTHCAAQVELFIIINLNRGTMWVFSNFFYMGITHVKLLISRDQAGFQRN